MDRAFNSVFRVENQDSSNWAERSEFWEKFQSENHGGAKRKFNYREPLIVCGHGVRIRIDHDTLLIRNGFTHYPQKQEEIRLFPGDANLPDRIVVLDGSGGISFQALNWMVEQQITLIQLDWRGRVSFVGGISAYSSHAKLVKAQLGIQKTSKSSKIAQWLIREKISQSIRTTSDVIPNSEIRNSGILRLCKYRREIAKPNISMSKALGIEGAAAAAYFRMWQGISLNWNNLKKKPIPANWNEIGPRQMSWRDTAQNARHPINAMLNYGYGMLASQMRMQVVAAGLDPSIGVMHGNKGNRIPLIYDLMEPLRPVVDQAILEFSIDQTFSPQDFVINRYGGCRLNPQLARIVAKRIRHDEAAKAIVQTFAHSII